MRRSAFCTSLFCSILSVSTRSESWPTLAYYVDSCVLIVLCRTERYEDGFRYKLEETWKGVYTPDLFYHKPDEGYLYTGSWHGNEKQKEGLQTVFFFTSSNHPAWTKGKLLDHSTSFQITDGKLTYASTGDFGIRREYTLPEFRKVITDRVRELFASDLQNRIRSSN